MEHFQKKRKWSPEEDQKLLSIVQSYTDQPVKWKEVSSNFSKTKSQCYSRYKQINPIIAKGKWTKEEEARLKELVSLLGKKWGIISKIMENRSGKQIRDHYINCLDEGVSRAEFSNEEDLQILELMKKYKTKWAMIAKFIPGRTGDAIKNRYNWWIRKRIVNNHLKSKISNQNSYKFLS